MDDKPEIRRFPHRMEFDGIVVDAIVLHPQGGKFALYSVAVTKPGGGTFQFRPREDSHETMEGIEEELRQLAKSM
jgi:hypothetical protein